MTALTPRGFRPNSLIAMAILHRTTTSSELKKYLVFVFEDILLCVPLFWLIEANFMHTGLYNCADSLPPALIESDVVQENDASEV